MKNSNIKRCYRITPANEKKLKSLSKKLKIGENELVRRAIDAYQIEK